MGEDPLSKKAELRAVPTVAQFIEDQYVPRGARKREVLDAKWEDFDFDRR